MSKLLKFSVLALTLGMTMSACEKDKDEVKVEPIQNDTVLVGPFSGVTTLNASKTYLLKGFVFVNDGAELIIPAGTTIKGDFLTRGTLVIKTGAKLTAIGTVANPIVFTSLQPAGTRNRADWGGIIINGKAAVNKAGGVGISEGNGGPYGGGASPNNADNSGTLKYVRIEYGGTKVSPDNEVNGLTLNSVGTGTTIEYVQTHMIADDGFEWFGGTVNGKYLVSSGNDDDAFDMDNGFNGKLQFIVALQDPDLANRGHEVDNDPTGSSATPFTLPTIYNATIIGAGKAKANDDNNDGLYYRRNSGAKMYNYIVTNFGGYGLFINGSGSWGKAKNDNLFLKNSILHNLVGAVAGTKEIGFSGTTATANSADSLITAWSINLQNPNLTSITFTTPDLRPSATVTGATPPNDGFFTTTATYIGALNTTTNWLSGWTNFSKK